MMRSSSYILMAACAIAGQGAFVWAADWPTWRYDTAQSAASPDGIAPDLVLLWSRKLPPVRQAWPREYEQRINFDASYEPVVMDKLLFLGSPNSGSVTAYDTQTGEEKWRFYAEGPVRCAARLLERQGLRRVGRRLSLLPGRENRRFALEIPWRRPIVRTVDSWATNIWFPFGRSGVGRSSPAAPSILVRESGRSSASSCMPWTLRRAGQNGPMTA